MEKKRPNEIKTHPTFESLFPIHPALLEKIEQDMHDGTYDLSQPIILATWQGQTEPVCIDGHTRRQAASNMGIEQVPVWIHEFETEDEAIEKAIKLQRNRRNMSDSELLTCIEVLDHKRAKGGDRRSEAEKSKAQGCAIENAAGKSAGQTGELLGISSRKVEMARTVMEHADEATKEAVKQGGLSINQAYEETQKKRRETKKAPVQDPKDSREESPSGATWPQYVGTITVETDEPNAPPTGVERRVTVVLPDWQYNGLLSLRSCCLETHVSKAVDLYVESLGIREEPEDDDEDYFGPEDYKED